MFRGVNFTERVAGGFNTVYGGVRRTFRVGANFITRKERQEDLGAPDFRSIRRIGGDFTKVGYLRYGMRFGSTFGTQRMQTLTFISRVNCGGVQVAATDGGPAWLADTNVAPSSFLTAAGSNSVSSANPVNNYGPNVPAYVPATIKNSVRFSSTTPMTYTFTATTAGIHCLRVYCGDNFYSTASSRVFRLSTNRGHVYDKIDLVKHFGVETVNLFEFCALLTNGDTFSITLSHIVEFPIISGLEFVRYGPVGA